MSPVVFSLGVLCHLSSLHWEPCVTCCHFPWKLLSPVVISLGGAMLPAVLSCPAMAGWAVTWRSPVPTAAGAVRLG